MSTNPRSIENLDDEYWFLQDSEVFDFTEQDKNDAINTLQILAAGLAGKDDSADSAAATFTSLAQNLKTMAAESARDYLSLYLNPDNLTSMSNVKSFMYLKKLSEVTFANSSTRNSNTLLLEKKLAENVVMNLLHLVFYKSLPCSSGTHCKHLPRKIVHKNDFFDVEMDCYFYHHEKDRRRFVLNDGQKEFKYAGNFGDSKRADFDNANFAHNFFESLFHPLYYKNFKCVRTKCDKSVYCPYIHSSEEKTIWSGVFRTFFGKDRDVFTKRRGGEENMKPVYSSSQQNQSRPYHHYQQQQPYGHGQKVTDGQKRRTPFRGNGSSSIKQAYY